MANSSPRRPAASGDVGELVLDWLGEGDGRAMVYLVR
jgi:hypothetical protein